jgi:hypothetical protein
VDAVKEILEDHGYTEVEQPQADDLVLYHDVSGEIVHCGLVRTASKDGLVLVESKWGVMGRFIHRPEDCTHGDRCTYYRTLRSGHSLRMVKGRQLAGSLAVVPLGPTSAAEAPHRQVRSKSAN